MIIWNPPTSKSHSVLDRIHDHLIKGWPMRKEIDNDNDMGDNSNVRVISVPFGISTLREDDNDIDKGRNTGG